VTEYVWIATRQTGDQKKPDMVGAFSSEKMMLDHLASIILDEACLEPIIEGEEMGVERFVMYKTKVDRRV
jgi:hypothetical protein